MRNAAAADAMAASRQAVSPFAQRGTAAERSSRTGEMTLEGGLEPPLRRKGHSRMVRRQSLVHTDDEGTIVAEEDEEYDDDEVMIARRAIRESMNSGDAPHAVRVLLKRVEELEERLREHQRDSEATRKEVRRRLDAGEQELSTICTTHDSLGLELDENYRRLLRTEQDLDTTRRHVMIAVERQRWKVISYGRAAMNNMLYYMIAYFFAYLWPMVMSLVRGVRYVVGGSIRSMMFRTSMGLGRETTVGVEPGSEDDT